MVIGQCVFFLFIDLCCVLNTERMSNNSTAVDIGLNGLSKKVTS